MTISLYALFAHTAETLTLDLLEARVLEVALKCGLVMRVSKEPHPFDGNRLNLLLQLKERWWARIFLESGDGVLSDSTHIANSIGGDAGRSISGRKLRVRFRFARDEEGSYIALFTGILRAMSELGDVLFVDPVSMEVVATS